MDAFFVCEKKVGGLQIDFSHQLWKKGGMFPSKIYRFDDILNCEIINDGSSVYKTKSGSMVGRAAIGAVVFGPIGVIIGGLTAKRAQQSFCSELCVNITVNDYSHPIVRITLISSRTQRDSYIYKAAVDKAQQIIATLKIMCEHVSNKPTSNSSQYIEVEDQQNGLPKDVHFERPTHNDLSSQYNSLDNASNTKKVAGYIIVLIGIVIIISLASKCNNGDPVSTTTSMQTALKTTIQTTIQESISIVTTTKLLYYIVSVNKLNLRENASSGSKILASLTKGVLLEELDEPEGDWVYVRTPDNIKGYVYLEYIEEDSGNSMTQASISDSTTTKNQNGVEIILEDGKAGEYGESVTIDGDEFIFYFIPVGTYSVEWLSSSTAKIGTLYVEENSSYKNSDGYTEYDVVMDAKFDATEGFGAKIISVKSDEHVFITVNGHFRLTKIG